MTEGYKQGVLKRAKNLQEYRETMDCKDLTLLSKLDNLIGYILALEEDD